MKKKEKYIPRLIIFIIIVGFGYWITLTIQYLGGFPSREIAMIQAVGIGLFWAIETKL